MIALIVSRDSDIVSLLVTIAKESGWETEFAKNSDEARSYIEDPHSGIRILLVHESVGSASSAAVANVAGELCAEAYGKHKINSVFVLNPVDISSEEKRTMDGNRISNLQKQYFFHDYFYTTSNRELLKSSLRKLHSDAAGVNPATRRERFTRHCFRLISEKGLDEELFNRLSVHPEKLYHPTMDYVRFNASGSFDTAVGLVFHALSPCGEGISFLASLGRDFSICRTHQVPCLRYCTQGSTWAKLNHSVKEIVNRANNSEYSWNVEESLRSLSLSRQAFLQRFDKRILKNMSNKKPDALVEQFPVIDARIVDIDHDNGNCDVSSVNAWVIEATRLAEEVFPNRLISDRQRATRTLDDKEKELIAKKSSRFTVSLIKSLKGALAVSQSLDDDTLRYFFAQNAYLDLIATSVLRIGPFLERAWDASFDYFIQDDGFRRYGGIYYQEYRLTDRWGLPYSYVSGKTLQGVNQPSDIGDSLIFLGDSREHIEKVLQGSVIAEARRLLSDLITFAQNAALFDDEVKDILRVLPKKWFHEDLFLISGSARATSWMRKALIPGPTPAKDECPSFLVPFLLTHSEWRSINAEVSIFIVELGRYAVKYGLTSRNQPLLNSVFSSQE